MENYYARYIDEHTIDENVPDSYTGPDGRYIVGDLTTKPEIMDALGFKRVREVPMPETIENGYHYERLYLDEPTEIVADWEAVKDPPRTFSKLKLKMALAQAGLLQQFLTVLQGVELIEGSGYMASDAFADAVNLSEANDGFKSAVKAAKDALGVTDEDVERILAASVAE